MTPNDYWKKEINKAVELATSSDDPPLPQISAALLIAGQLQAIVGQLSEIRAQLGQIEDSIANG